MHYSSDKQMQTISQTARLSRSCSNWVNPSPNPTAQAHAALRSTKINAKSNRAGETRSETAAARQHNARSIIHFHQNSHVRIPTGYLLALNFSYIF